MPWSAVKVCAAPSRCAFPACAACGYTRRTSGAAHSGGSSPRRRIAYTYVSSPAPYRSGPSTTSTAPNSPDRCSVSAARIADLSSGSNVVPADSMPVRGRPKRALLARKLAEDPADGIVIPVGHPLLEGNDGVVRDVNILRADLRAALGNVAQANARRLAYELRPVLRVQRVHLQLRQAHEEARPVELLLVLRVVTDDVADVLSEETLHS